MPKQYGIEGFAIVMFCASALLVVVGIMSRTGEYATWFPDGMMWVALCINAHSIISYAARKGI